MSEKMNFEQSMQRLEQIVRTMERGDAQLDESLKLFQEGTELVRACAEMLDKAQMQIHAVMTDAEGDPRLEVFDDDPDA